MKPSGQSCRRDGQTFDVRTVQLCTVLYHIHYKEVKVREEGGVLLRAGTLILYCAALYCTVICTSIFKVEKREDKEVCYHEEILMNSYTVLCIFVLYRFCTTI